jgi:DNA-binding XRE family transcriptional regulator
MGGADAVDAVAVGAQVRALRQAAGLSQGELAARAGISRQAVGACEAGTNLPRVDAALALARALDTTVEALLSPPPPEPLHVLGGELAHGRPVRAARVGHHTVCVPLLDVADGEVWAAPDGRMDDGRLVLAEDARLQAFVVVGCDPALGPLRDLAPSDGPGSLLPVSASSGAARLALTVGRAHAAIVHDLGPTEATDEDGVHRLPLATWSTGVAAAPDTAVGLLADAVAGHGPVVQREAGAGAQRAFERAVLRAGGRVPPGPRAVGHLDAARQALATGLPAVTIEPVARMLGLTFRPLETHHVEIRIDAAAVDHPGARVLGELVSSARLRGRLAAFAGYELAA